MQQVLSITSILYLLLYTYSCVSTMVKISVLVKIFKIENMLIFLNLRNSKMEIMEGTEVKGCLEPPAGMTVLIEHDGPMTTWKHFSGKRFSF